MKPRRSLRAAIDAKCKDCIYDPLSGMGTWRQQTEGCPAEACSLWPYRPVSASPQERTTRLGVQQPGKGNVSCDPGKAPKTGKEDGHGVR